MQLLSAPAGGARSFDANGSSAAAFRSGAVQLEPFSIASRASTSKQPNVSNAVAVFGGGREAQASILCWTEEGGYRLLDWAGGDVSCVAFISSSSSEMPGSAEDAEYVYLDRAGQLYLARLPDGLYTDTIWMSSVVRTGREYTKVISHDPTHTVIAASVQPCRFVLFDEDGEPIPTPDEAIESTHPSISTRGALELFIDEDKTTASDGYEFEANETVTALSIVILDAPRLPLDANSSLRPVRRLFMARTVPPKAPSISLRSLKSSRHPMRWVVIFD